MARKPRAEAPATLVNTRMSPQEIDRLRRAAEVNHQSISDFIRDAVSEAVGDCVET